jgi:predicted RNA polymerase sigma factor
VALLYEGLVRLAPGTGALVGRAAAVAELHGPEAGLRLLREIPDDAASDYQPYWALLAHVQRCLGEHGLARVAAERAIGLCEDAAMREFLMEQDWNG